MEDNPPPPPPSESLNQRVSPYMMKPRRAPPGHFYRPPKAPDLSDPFKAPIGPYFFYGSLADPGLLRDVLGLDSTPDLRPAYITGHTCKLWGQYPALVDAIDSKVEGAVYHVQTVKHGARLAEYETNNYRADYCRIHYTDGKEPSEEFGHTFKFQGNPRDLSEGQFDLQVWLKRIGR